MLLLIMLMFVYYDYITTIAIRDNNNYAPNLDIIMSVDIHLWIHLWTPLIVISGVSSFWLDISHSDRQEFTREYIDRSDSTADKR